MYNQTLNWVATPTAAITHWVSSLRVSYYHTLKNYLNNYQYCR